MIGKVGRPCLFRVCAVTRRRFPVGANPTRQPLQPQAIGAVMEVTKWLKPSGSVSRIGDSASVQAVTRVNAEQALYGAFFVKEFARAANLLSFVSFFVRSQSPFLRPDPRFTDVVARRSCQGWPPRPRCGMRRACEAIP